MAKGQGQRPQPWLIRIAHWVNIPLLVIMAGSGLQILTAYPNFGARGHLYKWWPWQGWEPPEKIRIGEWLAGARNWHFAFGWLLVGNALVYLIYLAASKQWRRRLFWPPRDTGPALAQIAYYLRIRKVAPPVDLYNSLQRLAYTSAIGLGILEVLSGFAIYKPTQVARLAWCFGGYDGARMVHFLGLAGLGLFTVTHVAMVLLHPRSLVEMITGGKRS